MRFESIVLLVVFASIDCKKEPRFAPYIDVTREEDFNLVELKQIYKVNAVSLAFSLGGIKGECQPTWAGQLPIGQQTIIDEIKAYRAMGGEVIVSTGGAAGPYLENSCHTSAELVNAYRKVLRIAESNHLDIDIEATVPSDIMNEALVTLQREIPSLTVSFTLGVMGDDYGVNVQLGIDNIKNAIKHGVEVDIVNPMAMEFSTRQASWGDAVIGAAEATIKQMKAIWPQKSDQELYSMLGVTPMIGKNMNGKIFEPIHARQLVDWAKQHNIGHLAFWSIGRDKGCPGRWVGPDCSSIDQKDFEFTKIFATFEDPNYVPPNPTAMTSAPTQATIKHLTEQTLVPSTQSHVTQPTVRPTQSIGPKDCTTAGTTYPHETDCSQYYVCFNGQPMPEQCGTGTIWDNTKHLCNFPKDSNRPECYKT